MKKKITSFALLYWLWPRLVFRAVIAIVSGIPPIHNFSVAIPEPKEKEPVR